jgi:TRAP transporter TAXI family solute receptor
MITRYKTIFAASIMAAAVMIAAPASAQMYAFGSGKQGSFTYSASAAIAKVAADNGMKLRLKPFGGQSAFVPGINAGEVQFGIANELETHYAVTGQAIYKGKPQKNLRVLAVLTPLYSEMFVRKDSSIKTTADLKGKRVATGYASQKVLNVLTQGVLANGGLTLADVQHVPVANVVGGASEFEQGKADAFMFAVGSGKVAEVDAKVGGVRVLPIDHSPKAMERMRKFIPVAYAGKLNSGKGRAGVAAPTWVYVIDFLVLVNKDVPDAEVYKLAKIMHDNKAELAAGFGPLNGFDPNRMAKEIGQVQFHPGAIKFYKEIGAWPPKGGS